MSDPHIHYEVVNIEGETLSHRYNLTLADITLHFWRQQGARCRLEEVSVREPNHIVTRRTVTDFDQES